MTSADHYKILLECIDVDFLRFQGSGQVMGFYIKDMSVRGYENCAKYEVGDYEGECIPLKCTKKEVILCQTTSLPAHICL